MAKESPDRPVLIHRDHVVSRQEFDLKTNRLARAFGDMGVGRGDMVTIALKNGIGFYEATAAALKLGAIPNPVSWRSAGH